MRKKSRVRNFWPWSRRKTNDRGTDRDGLRREVSEEQQQQPRKKVIKEIEIMQVKNANLIEQSLRYYESVMYVLDDVEGKLHGGIGHLFEYKQPQEVLDILGVRQREIVKGLQLTEDQVEKLFVYDVNRFLEDVAEWFDEEEWNKLDEVRQAAVFCMMYQQGENVFAKFPSCYKAILAHDWDLAADNMIYADVDSKRPSLWHQQTTTRCEQTAEAMRTGSWPGLEQYQTQPIQPEDEPEQPPQNEDEFATSILFTLSNAPDELKLEVFNHVAKGAVEILRYVNEQAPENEG